MSTAASVTLLSASNEPIRLSGPPSALSGFVRLRNSHPRSRVLRHMALSDRSGKLVGLAGRHAFRPIVVRGLEERVAPLAIALDRFTPPGEYTVDLAVEGQTREAVLNVEETVALRLAPKSLVLMGRPGETIRKHVDVSNDGNVPFEIDGIADVELHDDLAEARTVGRVIGPLLEELPKSGDGIVAALLAVGSRGPVVGHLRIHMTDGAFRLAPGQTASLELAITIPDGLAPHRRFSGRTAILAADLDFIVAPQGAHRPARAPQSERRHTPARKSGKR
ncbi:MAG: hypothetical protein JSS04_17555 [Proteobacteria bacterium]|nr:hypothetical protein [Pseudomonadota bacterium]